MALRDAPPGALPPIAADLARTGRAGMAELREASSGCHACDLWERATQTVFGRGPVPARLMLVGEQPGDQEDVAGEPFVGPAGRILSEALERAGIDREAAFVTNVVKHFKWRPTPGGKRRLHERPNAGEIKACLPWLEAELAVVEPQALVLLGATAAQSLLGPAFKVSERRGEFLDSPLAPLVMATVHPSSILRARDEESRRSAMAAFIDDLARIPAALGARSVPPSLA